MATVTAITTVWTTSVYKFFMTKTRPAIPTITGMNSHLGVIYKHAIRISGLEFLSD
jgi:hypothetical protein